MLALAVASWGWGADPVSVDDYSGVATLSCTDCSASSSSCGTSDFAELGSPGSPFSSRSSSSGQSESGCGSDADMPPNSLSLSAQWPWDRGPSPAPAPPASPVFQALNAPAPNGLAGAKRPRSASSDPLEKRRRGAAAQGKITEYFKAERKPSDGSAKKLRLSAPPPSAERVSASPPPPPVIRCKPAVTPAFGKPKLSAAPAVAACSPPAEPESDASPLTVCTGEQFSEKPSLPSPILRTPSIIRFPARNGWKGHFLSDVMCRWSGCDEYFSTGTALLEHLQIQHVNSQSLQETFVCLWSGCKVQGRASCSRSWLERHVLGHGGNKPFRCIVDGCGHRFSSQTILERHVNQHFNQSDNSSSSNSSNKKSLESTPNKLFRRNGKKLRLRRQPFSARMYDYMDAGIMEGLQHNLLAASKAQLECAVDTSGYATLHAKVIGRRTSAGTTSVLLRWFPPNLLDDEWVPQASAELTRRVPWSQLTEPLPPLFRGRPSCNRRKNSQPQRSR